MKKPAKSKNSFGAQLKALREELGLTQVEAAKILGVGRNTLITWEKGTDPNRQPHVLTQEGALTRLRACKP